MPNRHPHFPRQQPFQRHFYREYDRLSDSGANSADFRKLRVWAQAQQCSSNAVRSMVKRAKKKRTDGLRAADLCDTRVHDVQTFEPVTLDHVPAQHQLSATDVHHESVPAEQPPSVAATEHEAVSVVQSESVAESPLVDRREKKRRTPHNLRVPPMCVDTLQ